MNSNYNQIDEALNAGGLLSELASSTGKQLVFYCAYGERSAMALQKARELGIPSLHLKGGMDAWNRRGTS